MRFDSCRSARVLVVEASFARPGKGQADNLGLRTPPPGRPMEKGHLWTARTAGPGDKGQ